MSHTKIPLVTIAQSDAQPKAADATATQAKVSNVRRWPKGHPKAGKFVPKDAVIPAVNPVVTPPKPVPETMAAYKGFHIIYKEDNTPSYICQSTTFKIGKKLEIVHKTPIACQRGFHACENPFDVFSFYGITTGVAYGKVTLHGPFDKENNKVAAKGIVVDEIMSWPHLINTLAKFAYENSAKTPHVSLNNRKASGSYERYIIEAGQYASYSRTQNNVHDSYGLIQLSNVPHAIQFNHTASGTQIAVGFGSKQIGYSTQISHAEAASIINLGNGHVEVLGKNCSVLLHGSSRVKAVEGTKVTWLNTDGAPLKITIGEKDAEPNRWLRPIYESQSTRVTKLLKC